MVLVEQVYIFGPLNIHTFEPNISLISLIRLTFNHTKPRFFVLRVGTLKTPDTFMAKHTTRKVLFD